MSKARTKLLPTAAEAFCPNPKALFGSLELAVSEVSSSHLQFLDADDVPAEHHALYQYNLAGAANHYLGLPQSETVNAQQYCCKTVTHIDLALLSTEPCTPCTFQLRRCLP
jgi:hypothetical protein